VTDTVEVGTIIMWQGSVIPEKWAICDGTNGTIDLRNRFIYGRTRDTDASTGGENTHTHSGVNSSSSGGHSHTGGAVTGGAASGSVQYNTSYSVATCAAAGHTHSWTGGAVQTDGEHSHSVSLASASYTPPCMYLYYIMKIESGEGQATIPSGVIAIWNGLKATIPAGWVACDGNNFTPNLKGFFVMGASSDAEVKTTGGASTHTHSTMPSLQTLKTTHLHGGGSTSVSNGAGVSVQGSGAGYIVATVSHSHSVSCKETGNTTVTHSHTVTGASGTGSNLPSYRRLYYMMKT
jgi:hypothetical protein